MVEAARQHAAPSAPVFTIGHSSQPIAALIGLLQRHGIAALADVRSIPHSRYAPQFDREALRGALGAAGIRYAFMGAELGGRPRDESFYNSEGRVLYGRLAESEPFLRGIALIEQTRAKRRTALLCSEEDPRGCHRRLLIARVLAARGGSVLHIRGDGRLESEADLCAAGDGQMALFDAPPEGDAWTSVRSVLRSDPPPPSSVP